MVNKMCKIHRTCNFSASQLHLLTSIIPFISKKIDENVNLITFLEEDISDNIDMFSQNVKFNNKNEVLAMNWQKNRNEKFLEVNNYFEKNIKKGEENLIFTYGTKKYIENINQIFDRISSMNNNFNYKIVNCFNIVNFNGNIKNLLVQHDMILNSLGEFEIKNNNNSMFSNNKKIC